MPAYNQNKVIDKINSYLKSKERKLQLEYGYCHGLTLLWLYKMSEGNEEWFYKLIKKIVLHEVKRFDDIETDIEKLISHIEWLQSPSTYEFNVPQLAIHQSLGLPLENSLSYVFDRTSFTTALEKFISDNRMVCLSGPGHTIGVFKKETGYYIFDPNYDSGEAKFMTSVAELQDEIIKCLFTNFKLSTERLPILMNIIKSSEPTESKEMKGEFKISEKISFFKSLIPNTKSVNVKGDDDISPLYIACESGDQEEVDLLLKKRVTLEQKTKTGLTALHVAAGEGYHAITKKLLDAEANPNSLDKNQNTALKYAAQYGHEETAKVLLQYKANIDQSNKYNESPLHAAAKKGNDAMIKLLLEEKANPAIANNLEQTPLNIALTKQHWNTALIILEHITAITVLRKQDIQQLRTCKKSVLNIIQQKQKLKVEIKNLALIEKIFNVNLHNKADKPKALPKNKPGFFPYSRRVTRQSTSPILRPK